MHHATVLDRTVRFDHCAEIAVLRLGGARSREGVFVTRDFFAVDLCLAIRSEDDGEDFLLFAS